MHEMLVKKTKKISIIFFYIKNYIYFYIPKFFVKVLVVKILVLILY